jgi:hypothetical protein
VSEFGILTNISFVKCVDIVNKHTQIAQTRRYQLDHIVLFYILHLSLSLGGHYVRVKGFIHLPGEKHI